MTDATDASGARSAHGAASARVAEIDTAIETRAQFKVAIALALRCALDEHARAMWWLAPSFDDWPLDEAAVLDTLNRWALLPGRRLTLVTIDFDALSKTHPAFVRRRRDLAHAIVGRRPIDPEAMPAEALLLTDGGIVVSLPDASRPRGWCRRGGLDATRASARVDAITQRSEEAFATTVLGI